MAHGHGRAQQSVSVTGIWEFRLPPHCPCWSPLPARPWAASASIGAEVISQRSHGNSSCAWLGHGKGQANLGQLFFPRTRQRELRAPGHGDPSRQGLAQYQGAVSCRAFSPSDTVGRKIKKDNHYRGPSISHCTSGSLSSQYTRPWMK